MKNFFTLFILFLAAFTVNGQTIFLQEDFESGTLPVDWTQATDATDGGWVFGTSAQGSSSAFPIPSNGTKIAVTNDDGCNCNKLSDYLIMPAFDFSGVGAVTLRFDMFYFKGSYQGAVEEAWIEASTDGGTTWTKVGDEIPAGPTDAWTQGYFVNLSDYAGNSNVLVAFRYSDDGGWTYGWAIDNVAVFSPAENDVQLSRLTNPRFEVFGNDVAIQGEIVNLGAQNLTSFTVNWSDGINTYSEEITGTDIPYLGSYAFTHGTTMPLPQAVTYDFSVWVDSPNGADDADPSNNELDGIVSGVTYVPVKKMLAEEGTGTWCGWCPRGTDWMEYMTLEHDDSFVGVAVHNGDPMVLTEYDNGADFSAFPGATADRAILIDPSQLEAVLPSILEKIAPVSPGIDATLDVATMTLTANASAEFVTQLDDLNYRLSVILTEDHVTGTASNFGQVNYYSGQSDPLPGYGLDWGTLAATVPAADMYYDHVGRALLGGYNGMAGSIPASVIAGDVAAQEFTLNAFNKNWNPYNMYAIVAILDNSTGEVLNTEKTEIEVVCPADFGVTVNVTGATPGNADGSIEVSVADPNFGFGGYTFELSNGSTGATITDLPVGNYTLTVSDKIGCTQTVDVEVQNITGVQDIESLASFSLTPNPASSVSLLNARFTEAVDVQVAVINAAGQMMETVKFDRISNLQHSFDLGTYADGVYLVKVTVGNQVHTERLMIAR